MEKYGFVYIWYDKKRKMFYIGCHWGTKDDGYICSSNRMRNVYKRRPNDFKRRILKLIHTTRKDLLKEEFKWLNMIKDEELGKKYYNSQKHHYGHWSSDEYKSKIVRNKIMGNKNRLGKPKSQEEIEKLRKSNTGKKHSEETKKKISESKSGIPRSLIAIEKTRNSNKGKKRSGKALENIINGQRKRKMLRELISK